MAERTEYAPGTFCWVDLTTPDQAAAKAFYSALFDWQLEDFPVGEGAHYSIARLQGRDVAAIAPQPEQQRQAGVPPAWNSYIAVQSADDSARRAGELGANVHASAFDVMQAGRMAVIQDPQGAFFLLWQPREQKGAGLVNQPGTLVWNELASPDTRASAGFYEELFGWSVEPSLQEGPPYLMITNAGRLNGGIRDLEPPGTPPHWLVYFAVEGLEEALARIVALGGATLTGAIDIGRARIAVAADPQGAIFALYDGEVDS